MLGIVSERDIVRAMASQGATSGTLQAQQLMTRLLHTITPTTPIGEALAMMTDRRVRHLPVLEENGSLAGLISIGDLVKARIAEAEYEEEELKIFVTHSG